ncbi:hypothetical protein [Aurantibacter crassamenti]|uniref:hypothetical protein n=1 Tax=Aurantibacter crassamenti TaxID=1837375 RepID=UPI001EED979E|nr:hypothetical protein [Aurantibacter crassamenti]
MKITKLFFLMVFILLLNGCCKNCDELLEESDQELTDNFVHNLIVENSIKTQGLPLEKKGNLSLIVSSERSFGLFDEGFDIILEANKNISGIQLRVKRGDAISKEYIDIKFLEEFTKIEVDTDLSSEFGDGTNFGVAIGSICYEVRAYDRDGNISIPQDVCFDLIGWGNDGAIARAWELQYYEEHVNDQLLTRNLEEVYCDDGQENPCFSLKHKFLDVKDNGTFVLQSLSYEYENGDSDADKIRFEDILEGKWVYIENQLYLVVYGNKLLKNEALVTDENLKLGEGNIIVFQEITIDDDFQPVNMKLVVAEADDNGMGIEDKITEYYKRPIDD